MTSINDDKAAYKNLGGNNRSQSMKQQLDVFGTPMPVKSPINFQHRLEL